MVATVCIDSQGVFYIDYQEKGKMSQGSTSQIIGLVFASKLEKFNRWVEI